MDIPQAEVDRVQALGTFMQQESASRLARHKIILQRCRDGRSKCRAEVLRFKRELRKMHELQPCGHERRFIVGGDEGTNWCALCEAQNLRVLADRLMRENADLRMAEEATDETD